MMTISSAYTKRTYMAITLFAGAGIAFAFWYVLTSPIIFTDNAYTAADMAEVTSATSGIVKEIHAMDTQMVEEQTVLVVLDDTDANVLLAKAQAEFKQAEANLARTKINYERRKFLLSSKSGSAEDFTNAENDYHVAEALFSKSQADVTQATVNKERTIIRAPFAGVVAKRQVQLGQRVDVGKYLLSVVPLSKIYVNANFKEGQLTNVAIGQPAKIQSDIYGASITYRGTIVGVAGGTGAAFALIPAQNATGNWIKVIQRLPVRIVLNEEDLAKNPLRVGLSMSVSVDTSKKAG